MKKTKNIILSVVLALVFVVASVCVLWQTGSAPTFNGVYGNTFTAFAEESEPAQIGETKYMKSVDGKYMLLATAMYIQDIENYVEVGYYISKNGVGVKNEQLKSNEYYTGITVKTGETTTKTWTMQEIFADDELVTGMIVVEIDYSEKEGYQIKPYAKKTDASIVSGTTYAVEYKLTIGYNFMTFNIRTETNNDTGATNWSNRREAVVDVINNSGADVIGLQEVRKAQFEYINSNLASNYAGINFPRESGNTPEGLSIIYDKDKFDLVSTEKYWLSDTPDTQSKGWGEEYYRVCAVAVLRHKATGELLKAVNTHGPLLAEARQKGYELIMERSVSDDMFTFLCGDFNAQTTDPAYAAVASELQDTRYTAQTSETRDHNTFTGWSGTEEGDRIIDYCFVSNGNNVSVLNYEVRLDKYEYTDGNMYRVSDHYATQCVVEYSYYINSDVTDGGFDGDMDLAG